MIMNRKDSMGIWQKGLLSVFRCSSDEFEPDDEEEEDDVTGDEEEMIDKEMGLKSTEEEDESDLGTGNKVLKDEKGYQ